MNACNKDSLSSSSDDFKPLSVDHAKPGRLKVVGDEVNVSLPVVQVGLWNCLQCVMYDCDMMVRSLVPRH